MKEPSVLDYLLSLLDRRRPRIHVPAPSHKDQTGLKDAHEGIEPEKNVPVDFPLKPGAKSKVEQEPVELPAAIPKIKDAPNGNHRFPWRMVIALILALVAQRLLEPPDRHPAASIVLYVLSASLLTWSTLRQEWSLAPLNPANTTPFSFNFRTGYLLLSLPLLVLGFFLFTGNEFTLANLLIWLLVVVFSTIGLWNIADSHRKGNYSISNQLLRLRENGFSIHIQGWQLLLIIVAGLCIFFRFYQLGQIPGEMFSDHAEKLLDVSDVLDGAHPIYFPRNTGREAIQMYLTAAVAVVFQTGLSFISLKLGTAILGLLTLIFIYLLGKEVANKWVGLTALMMAGMAYWPNVVSRIGLRFPLYMLFASAVLFFLFRGLRTANRNDFIYSGIALGFGLHGYSPMRIVPVVVVVLVGLFLLHPEARGRRWSSVVALGVLAAVALVLFLPLLRYMTEQPEMFGYRAMTRLGNTERPLPGPPVLIFLDNLWKAWLMPFWKNGNIWVHSVTDRPALDIVTAVFYFSGSLLLLVRYLRRGQWSDLLLLTSVPLLMLPSILSLAFPDENPSLNRTDGAVAPVFVIAALAVEGFFRSLTKRWNPLPGKIVGFGMGAVLLCMSLLQNYDLVFNQFRVQFNGGAWNTSVIGKVIRSFADSVGDKDTAYVVPFPHWVDTRLVGINAGFPTKDYALWPDGFSETLADKRAKLFILKPEDEESRNKLRNLYPAGTTRIQKSPLEGKDFVIFFVPPRSRNE